MKHARAVVLHLGLLEVQVQGDRGHGGQAVPHHGGVRADNTQSNFNCLVLSI